MLRHGVAPSKKPILKPLETIRCTDAILDESGDEAVWPDADAIVGNPPFLGSYKMRSQLGDAYTERIRKVYEGRVAGGADLVIYWFEKALAQIVGQKSNVAGLVATNSIRQPTNRRVLERILATATISHAWSDEEWVNEGAAVRVSIVCFEQGPAVRSPTLDGREVASINSDLSASELGCDVLDLTKATPLPENAGKSNFGVALAGEFTVSQAVASEWLGSPNPNGRLNSDVLRPLWNGVDLTGRWNGRWVIDFGPTMTEADAALYELPFQHVVENVRPLRLANRERTRAVNWWRHGRPRPELRESLRELRRYVATSEKSKHRFFVWLPVSVLPDNRLIAFAKDDDAFFGVLSSRPHVCWALAVGSTLEDRPAYATTSCFDKYPFPLGLTPNLTESEYSNPHATEVSSAARRLNELRMAWLNPTEWCEEVEEVVPGYPTRIVAKPGKEEALAKRTLTNLYNAMPPWLQSAHRALDAAVALAYGWNDYSVDTPDLELLRRLFKLNQARKVA